MSLLVRDVSISCAKRYVGALHRHSGVPVSALAAFGAWKAGELVGVALVGRPVSRVMQARGDAEVTRLCTDGTWNACSILYAAARRWARQRGLGLITYTLATEPGSSLRAVGAEVEAQVREEGARPALVVNPCSPPSWTGRTQRPKAPLAPRLPLTSASFPNLRAETSAQPLDYRCLPG